MVNARALHYVFKIGNRKASVDFFKRVLKMKVLRHEEFKAGCEAACNGPYNGAWSKTMIGYGSEDDHFVIELTYNYGIGSYKNGNDFRGIHIKDDSLFSSIKLGDYPFSENNDKSLELFSPCGYRFVIHNVQNAKADSLFKCSLSSSNLSNSKIFWHETLGMKCVEDSPDHLILTFGQEQCNLEIVKINEPIDHAKAYGRIAFSTPAKNLSAIQETIINHNYTVLTPLISLDTPGKSTVQVVILADTDGHEICFVGDEAYRELSQMDPSANDLLTKAIEQDKSDDWFEQRGRKASE